ncbi:MAG: aminomethyl-transferring glycine dehydrogenase subunit GcvPB, partial [Aquificaceae bacterium]|nr:aminomethyl-transferring glycine dehydrogenase subunit GcvPB [Aquificaceae bacterium]
MLIFELSSKGRRGYNLPQLDVERIDPQAYLGEYFREDLKFPELSQLDVVRHYTRLSQLNYAIDTTMVPLGSCTMKYNPRINEELADIEGFKNLHPMTPDQYAQGTLRLI